MCSAVYCTAKVSKVCYFYYLFIQVFRIGATVLQVNTRGKREEPLYPSNLYQHKFLYSTVHVLVPGVMQFTCLLSITLPPFHYKLPVAGSHVACAKYIEDLIKNVSVFSPSHLALIQLLSIYNCLSVGHMSYVSRTFILYIAYSIYRAVFACVC